MHLYVSCVYDIEQYEARVVLVEACKEHREKYRHTERETQKHIQRKRQNEREKESERSRDTKEVAPWWYVDS